MASFEEVELKEEGDSKKPREKRQRMKKLLSEICSQMEFYFSDANLQKDRFLRQLMNSSNDQNIDLQVFTKCNKLRQLTTDIAVIAKALKRSKILELSSDGLKVHRKIPFEEPRDADHRTVYVESLPPDVTIEWLQQTFSICGKVVYVSLPRYKFTRYPKGFAFVEYDSAEAAKKACKVLNNCQSSTSDNVGKFPKGCKEILSLQKRLQMYEESTKLPSEEFSNKEILLNQNDMPESDINISSLKGMRKRVLEEETTNTEHGVKRRRENNSLDAINSNEQKSERPSDGCIECVETVEFHNDEGDTDDSKFVKKIPLADSLLEKKKQKMAEKDFLNDATRRRDVILRGNASDINVQQQQLRVISKKAWLELKREYVQKQRDRLHQLKEQLKAIESQTKQNTQLATDDMSKGIGKNELKFLPNVILRICSKYPMEKQQLKKQLSTIGQVAYVDISADLLNAYVRCENEESAQRLLHLPPSDLECSLLTGDEEKKYWEKVIADRNRKYDKNQSHDIKKKKQRGKDKVIAKADMVRAQVQHVIFD